MPSHSAPATGEPDDRVGAARYVASLSGDLAAIARRHGLTTLGYLLDMARLEAENEARPAGVNGR